MDTICDPFNAHWVRGSLAERARRVEAGADPVAERKALFEELWPWAQGLADRLARRLPAHADRNELRSRVLGAVWEATSRLDWDRPGAWPSLLKRRIAGARIDAARADDLLSRRDRHSYRQVTAVAARREQELGRVLTTEERAAIVRMHFPHRPELFAVLDSICHREELSVGDHDVPARGADLPDPADAALWRDRHERVQHWLRDTVPPEVARQLVDWAGLDRARPALPHRLEKRVRPYVEALSRELDVRPAAPAAVR